MATDATKFLKDVEFLRQKRVIVLDKEIVDNTGVSAGNLSSYLSGRMKPSKAYFSKFGQMMRRAAQENRLSFSYRDQVQPRFKLDRSQKKRDITPEELQKIFIHSRFNEDVKAMLFCVNTGLGRGEIDNIKHPEKNLRWKHIDKENVMRWKRAKTGKPFTVQLNEDAIMLMGERGDSDECVFKMGPVASVAYRLKKISEELEMPHTTFYCGRHTFITNSVGLTDLGTVSKMTGSDMKSLQHYVHTQEEKIKEAVKGLPSVFKK